ncbi:hypothetical protein RJ639_004660 [Escallonia herrerae]|uniref:TatD related DNase n=1 Tax=Escallonia herrerae TaxID=1293975 RepID=A0AA89AXP6_9ASTE|nr:hypothetical protein RJ639_004660 [Escallonia herrerae]
MMKLFDAHCHLQDPRIFKVAPQLIKTALNAGVVHFAVNGISEKDWNLVKEMSDDYPSIVPCFGLHPWFVAERTDSWLNSLKDFLRATPSAAVGEIGLDKGFQGRKTDFKDQVEIFRQQLELAKELKRPASIHCVHAFGDLLQIMKATGPFPAGVILHSYLGSAEMVPEFTKLGAYFSFSGFLMSMKENKAKKMLKAVPSERILLETDAPDALPEVHNLDTLFFIDTDSSVPEELRVQGENSTPSDVSPSERPSPGASDSSAVPKETLNHPANILNILTYVASLLELNEEELAELSYRNAVRLFSYADSKPLPYTSISRRRAANGDMEYSFEFEGLFSLCTAASRQPLVFFSRSYNPGSKDTLVHRCYGSSQESEDGRSTLELMRTGNSASNGVSILLS